MTAATAARTKKEDKTPSVNLAEYTAPIAAIVKVDAAEYGLQATEALQVETVFIPMITAMAALETDYNLVTEKVVSPEVCKEAKELRLKYVKIRTGTAEIHKIAKAYYLAGGRFVDGWKNAQAFASQGKEEALLAIEQHYENLERERMRIIREEREIELRLYTETLPEGLGSMTADTYAIYLQGVKTAHTAKLNAELDAKLKEAEAAKAKAIEDQRIRDENAKLKRDKMEADAIIAVADAKRAKEQKEADAILLAANKETARLAKIISDKEEADRIRDAQVAATNQRIAAEARVATERPDKIKLISWVVGFTITIPEMKTPEGKAKAADIAAKFAGFRKWANQEIQAL